MMTRNFTDAEIDLQGGYVLDLTDSDYDEIDYVAGTFLEDGTTEDRFEALGLAIEYVLVGGEQ